MKASLNHLPERKRAELARIVSKQERHRFDLLRQAYVGARYHDDYEITPQELKYLARCVELLREQVETSCDTIMESFV